MLKPHPEPEGIRICKCPPGTCLSEKDATTICAAATGETLANGYHPEPVWNQEEPLDNHPLEL